MGCMTDPKLFRELLGSAAKDLTDADVEHVLDWANRFSDAAIEWWKRVSIEEDIAFDTAIEEMGLNSEPAPERVMDEDGYWRLRSDVETERQNEMYAETR